MTKVKIFIHDDVQVLNQAINEFIKDKKVIDIKFTSIICHTEWRTYLGDRVLIIYEE